MQETILRHLKTGNIHFISCPAVMSGDGPISEAIKRIAENPCFNAVEITWIKDKKV